MIRNRLYLSQGDDSIYIDNCKIPQHHIEGIRFIYKQYRRFKRGVIINDPISIGRHIQIILFLNAVRPLLKKSVLILCQEGDEDTWRDRFHTWTDMYDDVIIESSNPTFRKQIIINAMVNLPVYCVREWSILIVDGENNTPTNLILKLPFKANFKIWNTSVNMKKDLDSFAAIFKWLFPTELFDKHYFIANAEDPVDVIEKSIYLDSFMEDIVLRRDDLEPSFEQYHREIMPPPKAITIATATTTTTNTTTATVTTSTCTSTTVTVTRKNKDAGGTKIKRSKPKVTVTEESQSNKPPLTAALTSLIGETPKVCEIFDSTEDFSIDNYKKKVMSDTGNIKEVNEPPFKIIEIGSTDEHRDSKLHEADSLSGTMVNKLEEMDTLVFGNDLCITKVSPNSEFTCDIDIEPAKVVLTTTNKPIEEINSSKTSTTNNFSGNISINLVDDDDDDCDDDDDDDDDEEDDDGNDDERDDKIESVLNKTKINPDKDISNSDNADDRLTMRLKDGVFTIMKLSEVNKINSDLGAKNCSEEIRNQKNSQDKSTDRLNDEIHLNTNELTIKRSKSDTKPEQSTLKRINIDDKMKEYEEKVAKKFKGSLLDSLF